MTHLLFTLFLALALMSAFWPLSLALRDVSIVDIVWGPAFALLGWSLFWANHGAGPRGIVALGLVTLWGARLSVHILTRRLKNGKEDYRYTTIRRKFGKYFPALSLAVIFWFQGILLWAISLPLQAAVVARGEPVPLDYVAWTIMLAGILIEHMADRELAAFRALPDHEGRVLDTGLWRLTRHPNYFGDFLIWWGFFVAGIAAGAPWWIIAGPIVMTALLMHFSGAGLMEDTIVDRRPAYRAYISRTSAFFPWRPKRD